MNAGVSPVESRRTSLSHPRWSYRCRVVTLRRRWCVRTGRSQVVWVHPVCTQKRCQRSRPATDHEEILLLYTKEHLNHHFLTCSLKSYWFICVFCIYSLLTSTSNRVDPYPGHSLMMLMYFSMAWCCGMPCRRAHFSSMLVRVADVSSFTHISSRCSPSTWNHPVKQQMKTSVLCPSFSTAHLLFLQWARFGPLQRAVPEGGSLSFLWARPDTALSSDWADHICYSSTSSGSGCCRCAYTGLGGLQDAVTEPSDRIDASQTPAGTPCSVAVEILETQRCQVLQSLLGGWEVSTYQRLVGLKDGKTTAYF